MDVQEEKARAEYVVVGGGIAGVSCVEMLKFLAPNSSVILVTATAVVKAIIDINHITKNLTSFSVSEEDAVDWAKTKGGVQVIRGAVVDIDSTVKKITVEQYGLVGYDKLCLCTGGKPRLVSDQPHVVGIRDTASVVHLQDRLATASRVIVLGNGGIASELVQELDNVQVVWAVRAASIGSVFLDPGAGQFLLAELMNKSEREEAREMKSKRLKYTVGRSEEGEQRTGSALGPDWHKGFSIKGNSEKKLKIFYEVEVEKILTPEEYRQSGPILTKVEDWPEPEDDTGWNLYVRLTEGSTIGCDFLVSATGVEPSGWEWADLLSLDSEGAVRVDSSMQTSQPHIYAAGDLCSADWTHATHWLQMRLWTQARQMGGMAARAMVAHNTGLQVELDFCFELFTHCTKFFGHKVILLGLFNGQKLDSQYEVLVRVTPGREYVKAVMKDGRMQGALLVGETDLEETFENLILNQLDLTDYGDDLLDPNIDIEDYFD